MCDITKENYELKFDEMVRSIQKASFIAFDAEYTCLALNNNLKPSLSDTAEMRYGKLRRNVMQSSVCQIGISAYVPSPSRPNSYSVQTFNVYLFPRPFGPIDSRFVCQASAVEFLCEHKFDFNKFMYKGVTYLNRVQEETLRKMHCLGRIKHNCDSMIMKDYDEGDVRTLLDSIGDWKHDAVAGDSRGFSAPDQEFGRYILLTDLKERFNDIICRFNKDKLLVLKSDDQDAVRKSFDEEFERLFQIQIGFSRIIREISSLKKPVVGHNCLTDLVFIFHKFHKSLPEKYKDFKTELHNLFPVIYDTKHLSLLLRRTMRDETSLFNDTKLEDLHKMLSSNQGTFYVLYSPFIEHAPEFDSYVNNHHAHEAGFDSYLTGFVFLRMAHFLAAKDTRSSEMRPLSFRQQLQAIKQFENCVNIARASLRFINFGGDDPPTAVPARFVVTLRSKNTEPLSASEIAHVFLPFGSADVQMEGLFHAIVTVSHRRRAKDVIQAFRYHRKYKVLPHDTNSYTRRDNLLKFGCGIVLLVASGSIVYLLLQPSAES